MRRLVLIFFLAATVANAQHWVSPTGAATYTNCSGTTPLSGTTACSLATANASAVAGDVINLRAGTYTTEINPAHSGTGTLPSGPFNRITFQAYSTEVPVIAPALDGIDLTGLAYIRVTGITFTFTAGAYRLQSSSNHNEIDHCVFNSTAGQNISMLINTNGSTNWSTHNWVHDNIFNTTGQAHGTSGTGCTDGGGDTLDIGVPGGSPGQTTDLDNNNTIENNVFNHAPHASTDNYGEFTVFRNNVYHNEPWSSGCTHTTVWPPNFSNTPAAYSGATTYSKGQTVTSGGTVYVSVANSNLNNAVTNTAFWQTAGTCTACVPNFTSYNGSYAHRNAQTTEDWGRLATYVLVEGNYYGYSGINDTNGAGENFDLAAPQNIVRYNLMYGAMSNNFVFKYSFGGAVGAGGNGGTYNRVYNNTMYMGGYGYPLGLTFISGNSSSPQQQANLNTYAGANSGIGNVLKNNIVFNGDGYSNWGTDFVSGAIGGTAPPYTVGNGWLDVLTALNNWCSGAQPNGTPAGACTKTGDPLFTNPNLSNPANTPDLSLQPTSPAINGGTFLTTATNSGTASTTLTVADAMYFQDGTWGSDLARSKAGLGGTFQADWIAIGTVTNVVQISAVTYGTNTAPAGTITLANAMTWSNGASIWLYKKSDGIQVLYGTAPDYGAKEFVSTPGPTPVVCPNNSQTGNNANCLQPPVLAFGSQALVGGVGTPSTPLPGSINNCSTTNIPTCSGRGSLQLGATVFTISGTNASDFTVQPGSCTINLIIASGGTCGFTVTFTPSAVAGTNETATLTIAYNGVTSSTVSLTGTSSDMTILTSSACPTVLTDGVLYQLGANIVCGGTAFQFGSNGYMNGNGFTITFNNTNQTVQTGAFLGTGFSNKLQLYNVTLQQGAGNNTAVTQPSSTIQAIVTSQTGKNFADGSVFANVTCNYSFQFWNCINTNGPNTTGGNSTVHDVVVNDTALGNCGQVGCRSALQSIPITQPSTANNGNTHWYNITINGSAQGALGSYAPGAVVEHNLIFIGSNSGSVGTNSNNFSIYCWGGCNAHDNIINMPLQSFTSGRGIQLSIFGGSGSKSVHNNVIQAYSLADNTEYSGCAIGGTYGIQFDDNTQTINNVNQNVVNVFAKDCGATGLRVTDSRVTTNTSTNNIYTATRLAGASTCIMGSLQDPQPGCAFGSTINGVFSPNTEAFVSTGDSFTADTGIICLCEGAANNSAVKFQSSIFNKGSNPSATWHTFWSTNGGPGQIYVIDAAVGAGVSLTDGSIPVQSANEGPTSFYIQWTQKTFVKAANNGKFLVGATVSYKDVLNNTVSCTTDATGSCLAVLTQYRLNNDTAANQLENRNPQTLTVSSTGCTTSTTTGLTISATATTTVQLANCGGNVDTALPATFFGFDQLLSGTGHENTGLVYGWQRTWDSPCVWGLIEATAGVYNFDAQCHGIIQSAVNHNAGVQFVMGRTPKSRITGTCSGNYSGSSTCAQLASDIDAANTITPAFITAWSNYMNTTWPGVKWRIEGRNESDLSGECAENSAIGGHCSMVHLVKEQQTIYTTVKGISASIQVMCPAASTFNHFSVHLYGGTDSASAPFTGSGYAAAGGLAFCDIMNVHPYFFSSGATCNPVTTGSNSACTPEEAVNGSFTCAATSTTMSGGLGQIACLLAANNLTGMAVESSETNWGKTPPNLLFANGGLSDTQRRQYIGRYIMYALNADQQGVTWYTWECASGNLAVCFGTLSGSSVSGASLTALGIMQDWLIGSTITVAAPCTVVNGTTYECAITVHTASGKTGAAEIVFDNGGNTPTISAFGATRAFRLDNTSQVITGNQYTVDGEPTLLFPLAPWTPGPNCRDYQNGSSQNGRSYTNGSTTANGKRCP